MLKDNVYMFATFSMQYSICLLLLSSKPIMTFLILIIAKLYRLQLLPLIQIDQEDEVLGCTSSLLVLVNWSIHRQFFPFQMLHTSCVCQIVLKNVVYPDLELYAQR